MSIEEMYQAESGQRQHFDVLQHQERMNALVEAAEMNLVTLLRPAIYIDGDKWCCLYGENIQDGVCGFGDTPRQAAMEFVRAWDKPIKEGATT